ncbi:VWA domain-containing protein [Thermodesulfobacteriota bacterium]
MTLARFWILHFLLLLPLAVVVLVVYNRKRKRALERFADPDLLARLTGKVQKGQRFLKGVLLLTALGLMLFALAGPRWGSHYQEVSQKGVDIMILVDVSRSMLVEDIYPNRLERARREILDFLRVVQGDRVGLVAFSGAAFVQCPLTLDYAALQMFLGALQPSLIPVPGTDLGAAIEAGLSSFDFESESDKVMLLITDGEDNEDRGVEATGKAVGKGVKIFVFGVGDTSGGPIPAEDGKGGFKKDRDGKLILSKLEEEGLSKIASLSGGTYVRSLAGDLDLDVLYFDGIKSRTEAQTLKSGKIKVYEERFSIFVLAAVLLLLLEGLILERRSIA